MPLARQTLDQGLADHPAGAGQQHSLAARWRRALRHAWVSGSSASLCSSVLISWFSHVRTTAVPAGTNATSHWLWGDRARHRHRWSLRHTLAGYLIHHASSVFWATGYERLRRGRVQPPSRTLALAAGTAIAAYVVDYAVVPKRLTPGFEAHLPPRDRYRVYAAFALGLALPALLSLLRRRTRRSDGTR